MRTYTILLLRPDYATDGYGQDTYMTSLEAGSVGEAQKLAQKEVFDADNEYSDPEYTDESDLNDYAVLMVIEGQHADVKEV